MQPSLNQYQQEIFASTERMMMQLQEHQSHLLKVQEEYLKYQAQYSQQCLHLMQQQYAFLAGNIAADIPVEASSNSLTPTLTNGFDSHVLGTHDPATLQTDLSPISIPLNSHPLNQADKIIETLPTDIWIKVGTESNIFTTPTESSNPVTPLPQPSPDVDLTSLATNLLEVVSKKTGYPTAMLELEMEIESDLGIDSIKRVEILGAMQELFPDLPSFSPEDLAELETLGQIVEYMGKKKIVR